MAIVWSFVGSIVAFLGVWAILQRSEHITVQVPSPRPSPGALARLLVLIFIMAVIEEGIFRWLLIGEGHRIMGLGPAFALSVILFTIAHRHNGPLSFLATMNLILVSLILGVVFWWWGFLSAVVAHFGWNAMEWLTGFTISGEKTRPLLPSPKERLIEGYPYGPESHWSATIIMMICLSLLIAPGVGPLFH
ncbi:CPBP family intramembrane glutamic endopeptidase [Sulfobacillus thermosulfidooxidans]|uniref:CPBP family intramembrane glutamic endopeptidase n=1 Tax=Sulfobacillus thermosulfidooxidans TaxID=28034 RepID=UPI0003F4EC43|nr:CPBP family intramembrane glutamic endopeptidase [Sulfobacillus thermosulfidooxidans]